MNTGVYIYIHTTYLVVTTHVCTDTKPGVLFCRQYSYFRLFVQSHILLMRW